MTRAADGLLAFCAACAEGLDVGAMTSPMLIGALAARLSEPRAQEWRRQELERRFHARQQERDLASGGIEPCPLCGRFRRLLVSNDGAVRVCKACAGAVPVGNLDRNQTIGALAEGHPSTHLARLQQAFPDPPPAKK